MRPTLPTLLKGAAQGLLALCILGAAAPAQAETALLPLMSPAAVRAGQTTQLKIATTISAAKIIPASVNVQLIAANGKVSVLGTLNDSGVAGDAVAGDGIWSGQVAVSPSAEGSLGVRVSFAVSGAVRRHFSPTASLTVLAADAPVSSALPDFSERATDPVSGADILGNQVVGCFVPGTTYDNVKAGAAAAGATPVGYIALAGNCYELQLAGSGPDAVTTAITALSANSQVQFAEPVPLLVGAADSCAATNPVCLDANYTRTLRLAEAHAYADGSGVTVAVLDSGIRDIDAVDRVQFPHLVFGSNFISPGDLPLDDDANLHGTRIAQIAQATAPQARLIVSKIMTPVLNPRTGKVEPTTVPGLMIDALAEAQHGGAKVANLSLGSRLQSQSTLNALDAIQSAGMILVAAAGNSGDSIREYPAAHVGVIAVGATDSTDVIWGESNFGTPINQWVNIAAPGFAILTDLNVSGTSFAAPWVTGTLAMMLSKYGPMSLVAARDQLFRTALPIPEQMGLDQCPNQPCNQSLGSGRLDPSAALGAIRFTRDTVVGASGASTERTITVRVQDASGVTINEQTMTFRGAVGTSDRCQVSMPGKPTRCIETLPFDFANLVPGSYRLQVSFAAQPASFFGLVQLTAPGTEFSAVLSGSGSIDAHDQMRASFSLFGAGSPRITTFSITKTL